MKINKILSSLTIVAAALLASACDDEKDLVVIEGNLPIKTSTLYMVGDATPNGWSIDNPTPLQATAEDPLVFTWEGTLNTGELKLCLTPGSWDAPFIRPVDNGTEINQTAIDGATFAMHAGDPDDKWRVTEAGVYRLTFDLRNWKMSTAYLGGKPVAPVEPIAADNVYLVGDATPNGWNIDAPTQFTKESEYIFSWEGPLQTGDFKCCLQTTSWDQPFIRPEADATEVNKDGVAVEDFVFTASPDNKWKVSYAANYKVVLDLEHCKINVQFVSDLPEPESKAIEADNVYMIGDATPNGWSLDNAQTFTRSASNKYIWTWTGSLVSGTFKCCTANDKGFDIPFIRPASADVTVSKAGVSANTFVYTQSPDDQWKVTDAGDYTITLDLENWTIDVKAAGSTKPDPDPDEYDPQALKTDALYIIGDATPGGWSMDNLTALTRSADNKYQYSWEGTLKTGEFKGCLKPDGTFSGPWVKPTKSGVTVTKDGVSDDKFMFGGDPDDKWVVRNSGRYRILFDVQKWTISVTYLGAAQSRRHH